MAINAGTAIAYLTLDSTKFQSGFKSAAQQMNTFRNEANTTQDKMKAVGGVMTSVGGSLTKSVSLPLAGVGAAALKAGVSFEQGMAQVKAISGATGKDFDNLREKAIEMGAKTKFSATESAEAMQYMAMAGWKTEDMLQGIEPIMNLAAASGEDLALVSDIVTDALTAFGLSAKDTTRFVDVLSAASANSNTNVSMLGESFKYVAPVAGALGYSVEDTSLALGLMANSGIKATQSGTALRTLLTNMSKPTKQMQMAMDTLGVSLEDENGNMKSLRQVMDELRTGFGQSTMSSEEFNSAMNDLNGQLERGEITQEQYDQALQDLTVSAYGVEGAEKAKLAAMLAGKEGMSGLLAIVNASEEDYNKLAGAIDNSNGATQEMTDIMQNTLKGAFDIFKSTLETAGIQISDVLIPIVREFAEWLTKIVKWFTELPAPVQEFIIKLGMLAVAIGPVMSLAGNLIKMFSHIFGIFGKVGGIVVKVAGFFGKFGTVFGKIMPILGKVGGAFKALWALILAHPIVAIVAAIVGLIGWLVHLYKTNDEFREKVNKAWDSIKEKVKDVVESIGKFFTETLPEAFSGFGEKIKEIGEKIKEFFLGVFDYIKEIPEHIKELGEGIREKIDDFFSGIHEKINLFFNDVKETILGWIENLGLDEVFGGIIENVEEIISDIIETIQGYFNSFAETVKSIVETVISFFTGDLASIPEIWSEWWTEITENVEGAINNIKDIFNNFVEIGKELFNNLLEFIGGIFDIDLSDIFTRFGETVQNIWDSVKKFFTETLPEVFSNFSEITLQDFIDRCTEWFNKLPENLGYAIGYAIGKIVAFGEDIVKNGKEYAKKFVEETIKFIKELPGKIKEWLDKTIDRVKQWGKNTVDKAKETWEGFKKKTEIGLKAAKMAVIVFVKEHIAKLKEWGRETIQKAKETWDDFKQKAKEGLENAVERTKNFVRDSADKLRQWKDDTIQKGKDAMHNFAENVSGKFEEIKGKIEDFKKNGIQNIKEWARETKNNAVEAANGLKNDFINGIKEVPKKVKEIIGNIPEYLRNLKETFKVCGHNLIVSFLNGISGAAKYVWEWVNEFIRNLSRAFNDFVGGLKKGFSAGKNGSHAGGLGYVPFDGYMAELHKGERVLTRKEAEEYNEGKNGSNTSGDTFNFYNTKPDPYTYYRQMKKAKRELLNNI